MSTLVVHPRDSSTLFLKTIYATISDKTIITGGVTKTELRKLIETHDRVIFLGHGSSNGLLAVGQFPYAGSYIIDETMVTLLSQKKDNIYIWCHADQFVIINQLSGFFSGMFISEIEEAWYYNFHDLERNTIEESNFRFVDIVSNYINESLDVLYKNVIQEYGLLAKKNVIAKFNCERLNLTEQNIFSCKINEFPY